MKVNIELKKGTHSPATEFPQPISPDVLPLVSIGLFRRKLYIKYYAIAEDQVKH